MCVTGAGGCEWCAICVMGGGSCSVSCSVCERLEDTSGESALPGREPQFPEGDLPLRIL